MKTLSLITLLLLAPAVSSAKTPAGLAGTYKADKGGGTLELKSDGSAVMAGKKTRWSVKGKKLKIGRESMQYTLKKGRLVLTRGSASTAWDKIPAKTREHAPAVKAGAGPGRPPGGEAARRRKHDKKPPAAAAKPASLWDLLTGSAWCSYTYDKIKATSATRKLVFMPDGVLKINEASETFGAARSGGQSNTARAALWKMKRKRVYADHGAGYRDTGLSVSPKPGGSTVLRLEGREYSKCN